MVKWTPSEKIRIVIESLITNIIIVINKSPGKANEINSVIDNPSIEIEVACIEICNMDPNKPIVLKGKHAREFEKYQKRKDTPEEIAFAKRAEKIYLKHSGPEQKNTK